MLSINYMCGYFESLGKRLLQWNVMLGFILAVIGLLMSIFARMIVRKIRKSKQIENSDNLLIIFKFTGLGLVVAGLIFTLIF